MKLEDIELKLGDILTFDDGFIDSVHTNEYTGKMVVPKKDQIVKIERYVGLPEYNFKLDGTGKGQYYSLETIWERKEETDDIEELKLYIDRTKNAKHKNILINQLKLQYKLNEVIRKINKGKSA